MKKLNILLLAISVSTSVIAQVPDSIPSPVLDFYDLAKVIKTPNPKAPKAVEQFGQLYGIWYCEGTMPDPLGQVEQVTYHAFWAWKYILDGYGVQDFWYQGKNEWPYWKYFQRDLMLTQLRVYDTQDSTWYISFINNNAREVPGRVFGNFTARAEGMDMVMDFVPQDSANLKRIVFYDITDESFMWRMENSKDDGNTWTVRSTISAVRVR